MTLTRAVAAPHPEERTAKTLGPKTKETVTQQRTATLTAEPLFRVRKACRVSNGRARKHAAFVTVVYVNTPR